ncbi:sugar ABC transporter permease [Streptomyces sp. CNQ-509]|uniref:carbohydrate ABC transporter permease n=1 Tax=unclassified Streptomyces TaxID=2593676 RepID=UPI00062DE610|nr:sugar ABC transporter permease [Streptomyces sp. CNQ-509]AKH82240.1 sugar ABC transporter permease [Streptomyces sp. CNQ-509]
MSTAVSASTKPGTSPPGKPQRRGRRSRGEARLAWYLITPAILLLAAVIGYPLVKAVYLSLFSDTIGEEAEFIGLGNYRRALTGDASADFWSAVQVTLLFAVVTVLLEVVIGTAMALVMHRAFRGRGLVRASVLVPWAIPTALTSVLWQWMLQPDGIVNGMTGETVLWTGSEWPATWAIIIADTWKTAPFLALLVLAGLQLIPDELHEAARVDGAGVWRRFRSITLPLLMPALMVAVLFRLLDVLRIYDLPQILTGGANGTTTLSMLVVQASVEQTKFGYGSALSTLTFLFIFVVALLFVRFLGTTLMPAEEGKES